jgi:histidyl-tRNA synthetase
MAEKTNQQSKLSTENYKGVRDFYPEENFIQNYIFSVWRKVVESYGYVEYNASVLEPAELYKAKSGEEIVNDQTYTFTDRGEREVTLRPEMTPTIARMVAQKEKVLSFPLRWYSIPNLFRYEKPQKGRLREHWQLNVDLVGIDSILADAEIISVAYNIMKTFGAKDENFVIKINSRKIINLLYKKFELTTENSNKVSKILDKKDKISKAAFDDSIKEIFGENSKEFEKLIESNEKLLESLGEESSERKELVGLIEELEKSGIKNIAFDPTLMRGFDYYTGAVFEVFDLNPDNNRSVFGGGRYDDLMDIFGTRKIPAVGFGAGDVTMRDFLETYNLLPLYRSTVDVYIATISKEYIAPANALAQKLREEGLNVALDLTNKKVGEQIKAADKQGAAFVVTIGEDEVKSEIYPLKNMKSGEEVKKRVEEIPEIVRS